MRLLDSTFLEVPFLDGPYSAGAAFVGEGFIRAASEFKIYAGTEEFVTMATDTPPSTPFHGTLTQALTFRRSILGGQRIGDFSAGYGETILNNDDGQYDFAIQRFAIDGRRALVKAGFAGQAYNQFEIVFDGLAADWQVNSSSLRIKLRDPSYKLDVPAQPEIYAGTGGAEGGADLQGKRKPLAYGELLNVEPPALVPASLIYDLHDGQIEAVDQVYDSGVPLVFDADYGSLALLTGATIPSGRYATSKADGKMRLGASPAGQVTVDMKGDAAGGYVDTVAEIVERVVLLATELTQDDLDPISFPRVLAEQPASIGFYLGPNNAVTASAVVAALMTSVGGWAGFKRTGLLEIGIFTAPALPATDRVTHPDVIDVDRDSLPSGLSPPPYRFRVAHQRNWTVQTSGLAGATTDARRAFVAQPYRLAESSDTDVLNDHPFAQDPPPVESFFVEEADAQAEADRLLALYKNVNSLYRVVLKGRALTYELGSVVNVTFPRWDLTQGRLLRVVELEENATENTVTIVGFG